MSYLQLKAAYHGFYATRIYLPFSGLSRRWRRFSRRVRRKPDRFLQTTRLPQVSWLACAQHHFVKLWEPQNANGNVRISELGILAALAADCRAGSALFEIGTFDGRTTLNLALNAPVPCRIYTLDLPPSHPTAFALAAGERHMVDKPRPGRRYEAYRDIFPAAVGRIHQLLGDSATFDYSPYRGACSLVFVDGSHSYDYVQSDTRVALELVEPGGVVVWHDYGVWEDVTRALEALEDRQGYGLQNLRGTSLVYWRKTT